MSSFAAVMSYAALEGDEEQVRWATETVDKVTGAFYAAWTDLVGAGVDPFDALKQVTDVFDEKGRATLSADDMGKAIQSLFLSELLAIDSETANVLSHRVEKERHEIPVEQRRT